MATADIINSIKTNLTNAYQLLDNFGASIPTSKNLQNLPATIKSAFYDTARPSLKGLKFALEVSDKTAFPANTIIPDQYNGAEFNWVVGRYGSATMSDGSNREGVYLFADRIVNTMSYGTSAYYSESAINTWLNDNFLSACSSTMKSMVSEISVTGSDAAHATNAKVWLMSIGEIMAYAPTTDNGGGIAWEAWKIRTGLYGPSHSINDGRVMKYNGSPKIWATRSIGQTATRVYYVDDDGYINTTQYTQTLGIVPAFFIAKD